MNNNKLPTLIFALFAITSVRAQQGEIIYREFDPPLEIVQSIYGPAQLLELDFDGDGEADHRYYGEYWDYHEWPLFEESLNGWETRLVNLDVNDTYTYDENDTIIPIAPDGWSHNPEFANYYYPNLNSNGIYHETYGMHKVIDGKNYYGWYHGFGTEGRLYSGGDYEFRVYIDKIAFCTVPDYPLRYGQTSLSTGLEETTSVALATLHPNPTTGLVTITGENLRQAEVLNMLGQQVLSVQGEGNELRIDMAALPAGVYFVNVTNDEGRKCVRKVVKE